MKILERFNEFHNEKFNVSAGVYIVEIKGEEKILVRHNDSVKIISFGLDDVVLCEVNEFITVELLDILLNEMSR